MSSWFLSRGFRAGNQARVFRYAFSAREQCAFPLLHELRLFYTQLVVKAQEVLKLAA